MRIGVIGAGKIGATVGRRLVEVGHEVAISNSRGRDAVKPVAEEIGAQAADAEDAARFGDVVVEAIPFGEYESLPADELRGKLVVDASNYYPGRDGKIEAVESGTASTALVAQHLDGARVVKAFNTMMWRHIADAGKPAGDPARLALPVAGDDDEAKRLVIDLIDQIGFDGVDAGSLADSNRQEPGTPVYGELLDADGVRDALAPAA